MKLLFLIGATSRIRNFHESLLILANRGHDITLAGRLRKGVFELEGIIDHERIAGRVNPTQRSDDWKEFVDFLRGARDYVRYFDPRYASATRLVRRVYEIAPTEFVLFCERHPWVKRHWKPVARALALAEDLIPADRGFVTFLREERPDLIAVTPLVTFESYQTDYVKAAQALGIPVVFIPFSWDNLTNKGLMRVLPDRVLVWNDVQLREAVELHGSNSDQVTIVGAPRFDVFFARKPATSREGFLRRNGLDSDKPMVLYLGSSQLTGPNEMELVRRWAESIRSSTDERVRTCNIMVRPHPALRNSWTSVDLSALGSVAMSMHASRNADQELFDSLSHAHAAVGLNTSAMLEAAIVGRPVHTLMIPGFDEGQRGTMHFQYLVNAYGGLATVAHDFAEHERQLSEVLRGSPKSSDKSRKFAAKFLRPRGLKLPVAPILAEEIERALVTEKRAQTTKPFWHLPLRRALLWWLKRRRVERAASTDTTVVATSMSLRPVRTALEEMQQATTPIFVGPWNDSAGAEALYWVPFVRWAAAAYRLPAERLFVLTHEGRGRWYGTLASRHLDIRTLFAADEFEYWQQRTVPQSEQDPKQAVMSPFDTEIVERAARAFELSEYRVLHPSMWFRAIGRLQKDLTPERAVDLLQYERLASNGTGPALDGLPKKFVAASVAFTTLLPPSEENGEHVSELVSQTAATHDVVLLDEPAAGIRIPNSPRVHRLPITGADPTSTRIAALERASAFVGGFGDLAILSAFVGTPVRACHDGGLPVGQADHLAFAATRGWATITLEQAKGLEPSRS